MTELIALESPVRIEALEKSCYNNYGSDAIDFYAIKTNIYDFAEAGIRLNPVRNNLLAYFRDSPEERDSLLGFLVDIFEEWRDCSEYMIVRHKISKKAFAVKCSKRGNDVFARRLDRSLGFLKTNRVFFDPRQNWPLKTNLIWVTLTYNSNLCSLDTAWNNFMSEFNLWITNLRNKYGHVWYTSFPQAFPGKDGKAYGYPHFHLIMLFPDYEFEVFRHFEKDRFTGEFGAVYRIQEKDDLDIQGRWHSFTDVKAMSSMRSVYAYAKKHCFNVGYGSSEEACLNNSVMWLYRKKSFNMSGTFRKSYLEFIKSLRNSKLVAFALDGKRIGLVSDWEFLGIYPVSRLWSGLDPPGWSFGISRSLLNSLGLSSDSF